jgi:hypothetical protein
MPLAALIEITSRSFQALQLHLRSTSSSSIVTNIASKMHTPSFHHQILSFHHIIIFYQRAQLGFQSCTMQKILIRIEHVKRRVELSIIRANARGKNWQ